MHNNWIKLFHAIALLVPPQSGSYVKQSKGEEDPEIHLREQQGGPDVKYLLTNRHQSRTGIGVSWDTRLLWLRLYWYWRLLRSSSSLFLHGSLFNVVRKLGGWHPVGFLGIGLEFGRAEFGLCKSSCRVSDRLVWRSRRLKRRETSRSCTWRPSIHWKLRGMLLLLLLLGFARRCYCRWRSLRRDIGCCCHCCGSRRRIGIQGQPSHGQIEVVQWQEIALELVLLTRGCGGHRCSRSRSHGGGLRAAVGLVAAATAVVIIL